MKEMERVDMKIKEIKENKKTISSVAAISR